MKLHLESNIAEGTPEELVEYLRLVEGNISDNQLFCFGHAHRPDEDTLKSLIGSLVKVDKEYTDSTESSTEGADGLLGYTFWYLDTANFNNFVVLKASLEGYFEASTGKRYTYQAVSGYVRPVDREDVREEFERARDKRALLSYYPVVDEFATSY